MTRRNLFSALLCAPAGAAVAQEQDPGPKLSVRWHTERAYLVVACDIADQFVRAFEVRAWWRNPDGTEASRSFIATRGENGEAVCYIPNAPAPIICIQAWALRWAETFASSVGKES